MQKFTRSLKILISTSVVIALMLCLESIPSTKKASAASVTPTAAPTVRPATLAERALFMQYAPHSGWIIDQYAVAGPYALIGFSNGYGGVTDLLTNINGQWVEVTGGGGGMTADEILQGLPTIPTSVAQSLYNLGYSQAAATVLPSTAP